MGMTQHLLDPHVEKSRRADPRGGRRLWPKMKFAVACLDLATSSQGRLLLRADGELLVTVQRPARSGRSLRRATRRAGNAAQSRGQLRQGGWSLDEVADAEMSHVRDSFGTVVVTEFGSSFLAGVHSGDSGATRVMGCPLGDVVNFSRDDDPAVVPSVVQGDLFARDGACTPGGSSRQPELAGDRGVVGLGGSAEVPRS